MLKKRLIFVLYFMDGQFCLSRNFRLQKAGDINWLLKRFRFSTIGRQLDELVLLNVDRNNQSGEMPENFWEAARAIMRTTFTPLCVGGGLRNLASLGPCFAHGADKVILTTALAKDPDFFSQCVAHYGSQAVVAGLDVRRDSGGYTTFVENGTEPSMGLAEALQRAAQLQAGEVFVNSIDQDGTGMGYDPAILDYLEEATMPVILAGGAGKLEHFSALLSDPRVSATATGNLFNFIGDGFTKVRRHLVDQGLPVRQ